MSTSSSFVVAKPTDDCADVVFPAFASVLFVFICFCLFSILLNSNVPEYAAERIMSGIKELGKKEIIFAF